jgi:uncharacterized protein involved in tolerance to divalent cations
LVRPVHREQFHAKRESRSFIYTWKNPVRQVMIELFVQTINKQCTGLKKKLQELHAQNKLNSEWM